MLSYVYYGTDDLERATRFYDATLAPLGMQRCVTGDPDRDRIAAGWGIYQDGGAHELGFWIAKAFNQQPATTGNGSMVAFRASMRPMCAIRMAISLPLSAAASGSGSD